MRVVSVFFVFTFRLVPLNPPGTILEAKVPSNCHGARPVCPTSICGADGKPFLKGGQNAGPAIVSRAKAEASLLYKAVKRRRADLQMARREKVGLNPLGGRRKYAFGINAGGRLESKHRSSGNMVVVSGSRCAPWVPLVKNARWVRNPLDAFILAKLEQARF